MKFASATTERLGLKKDVFRNFSSGAAVFPPKRSANEKAAEPAMGNKIPRFLFHLTSDLTAWFPRAGPRFLNGLVLPLLGHCWLVRTVYKKNSQVIQKLKRVRRILVIPDIHIGDAIMMQGAVQAFRDF